LVIGKKIIQLEKKLIQNGVKEFSLNLVDFEELFSACLTAVDEPYLLKLAGKNILPRLWL